MTKERIKRKWEYIHDELPKHVKDSSVLKELRLMAKTIDRLLMKAYPYCPTTEEWEDDWKDGIIQEEVFRVVIGDSTYCIGCVIDEISMTFCAQCRFNKLDSCCTDKGSLYMNFITLYDSYDVENNR